jgi:hypothetical protein
MIFWRALINHPDRPMLIDVYTGTTLNMVLTRVSQPLRCMSLPYEASCLSATRSSRGWSTDLGSIVIDRGMLRYLTQKSTLRMGKIVAARATCSCEQ